MKPVWISGWGAVGPGGFDVTLPQTGTHPEKKAKRVPGGLPLKDGFSPGALRWLDRSSLWWVNAVRRALPENKESQAGQVVGIGWGSIAPTQSFISEFYRSGFEGMSPALFPFTVANAPAGQAGVLLSLKGGTITVNAREAAGLAAIVSGARMAATGLIPIGAAGAVDDLSGLLHYSLAKLRPPGSLPLGEGAYAVGLTADTPPAQLPGVRIAAWASASAPGGSHLFPADPAALWSRLEAGLRMRCGWGSNAADMLFLSQDVPALEDASRRWAAAEGAEKALVPFQGSLGACGASWAGAVILAARAIQESRGRRAMLMALSTGGSAYGLALEDGGAE